MVPERLQRAPLLASVLGVQCSKRPHHAVFGCTFRVPHGLLPCLRVERLSGPACAESPGSRAPRARLVAAHSGCAWQARGLAQAQLLLAGAPGGLTAELAARAALAAGESMLAFAFAAVALEAALQRGLVAPFGAADRGPLGGGSAER